MNTTNNTVLITGGSMGIGFQIAKVLSEKGNHVIITGRDNKRLQEAAARLSNVTAIQFDVTSEDDVNRLTETLRKDFPSINILINNAGLANMFNPADTEKGWEKAAAEINTNYVSLIRLTEKLLPLLKQQPSSAIVNVSSVAALVPSTRLTTYSASKAAVHFYTVSLRAALESSSVKVFELMPPLVATDFSKEIGGLEKGIPPLQVATELLDALENDVYEIHVGLTAQVYELLKQSPEIAFQAFNSAE